MKMIASTILAITLVATPALASQPLLFEWSGTDENSNPFTITYTVTNVQAGDPTYEFNNFAASGVFTTTETANQSLVITDVTGDILGGTYKLADADIFDPYLFVDTGDDNGNTKISLFAGADTGDIGFTINGNLVNWVTLEGTADFSYVDPTTATSYADLFPLGTYNISVPTGQTFTGDIKSNNFMDELDLIPTSLTISAIPEPTTAALLALGGLAMLRRRRKTC